jgi:hypothetical protein
MLSTVYLLWNSGSHQIGDTIDILSSARADLLPAGTELLRIIALTAMSCNDAHSNHWFWKYFYLVGRPVTQYRQVPLDQPAGLGEQQDEGWGAPDAMVLVIMAFNSLLLLELTYVLWLSGHESESRAPVRARFSHERPYCLLSGVIWR